MSEMLAMFEGICHQCQTNIPRYIQCAMSEPFYWFAIGFAFNFWNHSAIRKACVWSYFGRNSKVEGSACQAPRFLAKGLRNWWKAQFCGIHLEWLVGWFHWFYVQHVKLSTRKLRTFATWLSLRWRKSGRLWILLRVSQLQTDIDRSYENVYLISGSNMVEHKPTSLHEFLFEMTTRGHHDVYKTFVQVWCRSNVPCITWLH